MNNKNNTNEIQIRDHEIDQFVGGKVKLRRRILGLTQSQLAEQLELTFQQIQKYERGSNRISASKLYQLALFLKVPISYFYEGLGQQQAGYKLPHNNQAGIAVAEDRKDFATTASDAYQDPLQDPEVQDLIRDFTRIKHKDMRKQVLDMAKLMANLPHTEGDQSEDNTELTE